MVDVGDDRHVAQVRRSDDNSTTGHNRDLKKRGNVRQALTHAQRGGAAIVRDSTLQVQARGFPLLPLETFSSLYAV
jgi:hypothetical protein